MFSERDTKGPVLRKGSIEVVCGSMFSGKTEELIRRMKRAKFAKQKVEIFKPTIDTRQLLAISLAMGVDFFGLYSQCLKDNQCLSERPQ